MICSKGSDDKNNLVVHQQQKTIFHAGSKGTKLNKTNMSGNELNDFHTHVQHIVSSCQQNKYSWVLIYEAKSNEHFLKWFARL